MSSQVPHTQEFRPKFLQRSEISRSPNTFLPSVSTTWHRLWFGK